jgi:hypothetical protein
MPSHAQPQIFLTSLLSPNPVNLVNPVKNSPPKFR